MATILSKCFLIILGFLLLGYASLGKGFSYLGVPPIYVGEIVLGLGFVMLAFTGGMRQACRSPLTKLVILYMIWGAICTFPYIGKYGLSALRDAVVWGYGLYAILVAAALLRSGLLQRTLTWYARIFPWLLLWWPLALYLQYFASQSLPVTGENDREVIRLIYLTAGNIGVHLAGIAAFLLLGLRQIFRKTGPASWLTDALCWVAWMGCAVIVASISRAAFLSIALPFLLLLLLKRSELRKELALVIIGLSVVLTAGFIGNLSIDIGKVRDISFSQIMENTTSISGESYRGNLESTKEWRLAWWNDILAYTLFGEYFWTGKGFGINLAEDDGYAEPALSLRSPHNSHMTTLARSGVPGFALWVTLQGLFGIMLLKAFFRARRSGQEGFAGVNLFILAYWLAFIINCTFDVFLEGPHAGIWFWSLFGTGIALLEVQRAPIIKKYALDNSL